MPTSPRCTRCGNVISQGYQQCNECRRLAEFGVQGQVRQFGTSGDTQSGQSYPSGPPPLKGTK